jgi:4-hydroxythreonine-4-phosphate dehydrogenase
MGDPAGVGPELLLKACAQRTTQTPAGAGPDWFCVGDPDVIATTARQLGLPHTAHILSDPVTVDSLVETLAGMKRPAAGVMAILPTRERIATASLRPGHPDPAHAAATLESITTACRLARHGVVHAMVTNPIHKATLHAAGFDLPGHTEYLARCVDSPTPPVMMLTGRGLRVVPATIHQSLASVSASLTPDLLRHVIGTTWQALRQDFALAAPRLAVTALNPHAGEQGAFGHEEIDTIAPVCAELRAVLGPGSLLGPLSADSLFHSSRRRDFDAVVCMYHDQALIPLKMLAFGQAVNVTLGLPVIRTSVDHGTAHDIAGRGIADPASLQCALRLAGRIARNRQRWQHRQ